MSMAPITSSSAARVAEVMTLGVSRDETHFKAQLQDATHARAAKKLREATAQFVATAFLTPMLKQVRNDPFKSELFHGGQGEKIFGAQLDEQMADEIASSPSFPLVDHLYEHFARRLNFNTKVNVHG